MNVSDFLAHLEDGEGLDSSLKEICQGCGLLNDWPATILTSLKRIVNLVVSQLNLSIKTSLCLCKDNPSILAAMS